MTDGKYEYYDKEGALIRRIKGEPIGEIYRGDDQWERYYGDTNFATVITHDPAEVEKLKGELDVSIREFKARG